MASKHLVSLCCVVATGLCLTTAGCSSPSGPGFLQGKGGLPSTRLWTRSSNRPDLPDAAERLKKPDDLYLKYAQWQEEIGKLVEARKSYEMVLGENPKSVDALLGLARLDHLGGRVEQAEQRYLKALRLRPNEPDVLDALGQFYAAEERWTQAIDVLKTAVKAVPDHPTYRYHLAVALARSGQIEQARPHFVRTVGEAQADYNIGYIFYEQEKLAEAEQRFQQALRKNPQLTQAQLMLEELQGGHEDQPLMAQGPGTDPESDSESSVSPRSSGNSQVRANSSGSVHQVTRSIAPQKHRLSKPSMSANQSGRPVRADASGANTASASGLPPTFLSQGQSRAQTPTGVPGEEEAGGSPSGSRLVRPHGSQITPQQREQWQNQRRLDLAN